jgi:signal peptidase II
MKNILLRISIIVIAILLNAGCDQATKIIAKNTLKNQGTIQVIDSLFILTYAENNGAFLNMGSQWLAPLKMVFLIYIPLAFLLGMIIYICIPGNLNNLQTICFACIAGGGMSNIFDRIFHNGLVSDFMNFGIGSTFRTGILNCADLSVFFGAVILMISYLLSPKPGKKVPV